MKTNNKLHRRVATMAITLCATLMLTMATPAYAAILVQNFMQFDVVVDTPPIEKIAGADDATSTYLTVNLGGTISNSDNTLPTPGANATNLSHEEISFTCFAGDRTYYTDVFQLNNTDAAAAWDVNLTVESDLAGNAAVSDTFSAGDADIWLFVSEIDSTGGALVTETPNPGNYTSLTEWYDNDAGDGGVQAIQLEVNAGTLSTAQASTGQFSIPSGEDRQVALVVDCGANMVDTETGTFRVTVAATP